MKAKRLPSVFALPNLVNVYHLKLSPRTAGSL